MGHNLPTELTTKMKNLHSSKDTANKMKQQATDYEETFTICLTKDCTRTYTELPKLTKKKTIMSGQEPCTDTSEMVHKLPLHLMKSM